jgi:hypothetical protein
MGTASKSLTDEQIAAVCDLPWPQSGPYIPHEPHIKQHAFLWLDCQEAMYGGAAGGGKSDALLMAALQHVDTPSYAALLLRKTYTELMLENALLDRSHKWLAHTDAHWNGETMRWTFPSGATVGFGYLANMRDRARYQSAEWQYIGFDELTQFDESDYRFMFSRLRRVVGVELPLRMRSGTNPGGPGHRWVKARFIDPYLNNTQTPDRVFIPSRLWDNPSIDTETYVKGLDMLEPELREQLLEGNWDAREPGDWMIPDHRWIDAAEELGYDLWEKGPPSPIDESLYLGIDWGEHTAGYVIWPLEGGGILIPPSEVTAEHEDPVTTSHKLLQAGLRFDYPLIGARYDAAGVQSNRTFVNIARRVPGLGRFRSTAIPFNKYKRESVGYMRTLFRRTFAGESVRIIAVHPDNVELLRQLRSWRRKGPELDEAIKEDDHGPDAVVAGIAPIAAENRAFIERQFQEAYGDTDDAYLLHGDDNRGAGYVAT